MKDNIAENMALPIEMKHTELRVTGTANQDSLTPTSGKKIRVLGMYISSTVTTALTSTVRGTVAFGTGNIADVDKILWSGRKTKAEDTTETWIQSINCVGVVDETVTLTNTTYSNGTVITRAIIYYVEV